jgi:transposase
MSRKRTRYSREFKLEALELARSIGPREASKSVGVPAGTLWRWRRELGTKGELAFPGNGVRSPADDELARLREENRRLRMEREILKKAAAFFASDER